MVAVSELWFPGAEPLPGPARKTSGTSWPKQGVVMHSAEGSWPGLRSVLMARDGGSWHFSNLKDGRLYQHYPIDVIAWHARGGNTKYVGVEHEGKAGEPLTELQISNAVGLIRWMKEVCEWDDLSRVRPDGNMVEHNEVGRENNYVTACPSRGRIPWVKIMTRVEKGDNMELLKQLEKNAKWGSVMRALDAKLSAGVRPTDAEIALGRWVLAEVEKAD